MTQPLIDLTQLGSDITVLLPPTPVGVTPGYVATSNGSTIVWSQTSAVSLAGLSDVTLTSPTNGQVLTFNGAKWVNLAPATSSGTVTSVAATGGTGITVSGSPITTNGTLTFTLGTELQALSQITTDGFIQRTGGVYQGAALTSSQVTTALGFTPLSTISLTGDITSVQSSPGVFSTTLATVNSNVGAFNTLTVNAKGLVTSATNTPYITTNQTITVSGDASGSGSTTLVLTLASVNSNVGTFGSTTQIPTFTVNAKGLITAASSVALTRPIFTSTTQGEVSASGGGTSNFLRADGTWSAPPISSGTVTSVAAISSTNGLSITGSPITTTGTLSFSLGAELVGLNTLSSSGTGVVQRTGAGAYTAAALTSSQITTALGYTPVAPTFTVTTTSPLVGGATLGTSPLALSILPFNGAQNGYVVKNSSIQNYFLRDDGSWQAPPPGTVTSVAASGGTTGLTFTGSPITTSGTLTLSGTLGIANGGTGQTTAVNAINALLPSQTGNSGQFLTTNGTVASWGTVAIGVSSFNTRTGAVTLTSADVTTALGYTPIAANQTITLSGDVTGSGTTAITTTLATVNSNTGTYGSATVVPTITVNGKGLVTAVTTNTITPAGIGAATTTGSNATGTWTISISGLAATSTTALNLTTADVTTNATLYPLFTTGINGSDAVETSSTNYTFNPSTGTLYATTFNGAHVGNGSGLTNIPTTALTGLIQAANFPALTGAITNTAGTFVTALSNTGVTAGSYTNANITVGADGRITAASTGGGSGGGSINQISSSGNGITVTNATGPTTTLGLAAIPNSALTNNSITITPGLGLGGGGSVALGGSVSLINSGVTSAVAGTGIGVSAATGAVTISNTGVYSITGTANEIVASASTGAVTLSFAPTGVSIPVPTSGTSATLTVTGGASNAGLNIAAGALQLNGSAGTAGQVLMSAGAGTLPTWGSVTSGVSSVTAAGAGITASPTTGAVVLQNTGVLSFNTRTGAVTLTSADVTTALGYTPQTGTVTSVSVTTANGVSGSVATATTTPAITLTLGAITPTSVTTATASVTSTLTLPGGGTAVTPNSYGCISLTGGVGGYSGIQFGSTTDLTTLMVQNSSATPVTGMYNVTNSQWMWYFSGSTLTVGTVPGANVSGAVALATTSNGVNMSQQSGSAANDLVVAVAGSGSGSIQYSAGATLTAGGAFTAGSYNGYTIAGQSVTPGANQIVHTDPNAYLYTSYINISPDVESFTAVNLYANNGSDNFLRKIAASAVTVGGATTATNANNVITYGNRTDNANYPIVWSNPGGTAYQPNYSCAAVTINSSTGTVNATLFNSTSDINRKDNITKIDNALNIIESLNGVRFNWKDNGQPSAGLIAQDVENVMPELVKEVDETKTLNYNGIIGALVEAIKEMNATHKSEIALLRAEIELLKGK